jgi:large subunit ribosomal protein L5
MSKKATVSSGSDVVLNSKQKYEKYLKETGLDPVKAPKILKISLTISPGPLDKKMAVKVQEDLTKIAGQKAMQVVAKKSESSFHLREGMTVGARVTLRKDKMYSFMDNLIYIALPRVRDFRGLQASASDSNNNYAFGLKDITVFPQVDFSTSLSKTTGIGIAIETQNISTRAELVAFLKYFDFPIR